MIELKGHAGVAPLGQDLVCAGLSTLTVTLAEFLAETDKGSSMIRDDGYARFAIPEAFERDTALAVCGFRWLAKEFPQYVSIEEGA